MDKKITPKLNFKFDPPEEKDLKKLNFKTSFKKAQSKKKKIKIIKIKKENDVKNGSTGLF